MTTLAPRRYCPSCGRRDHGNTACGLYGIGSHWTIGRVERLEDLKERLVKAARDGSEQALDDAIADYRAWKEGRP